MWQNRLLFLLGNWILGVGCLEFLPFLTALGMGEEKAVGAFGASMVLTLLTGGGLYLGFRSAERVPTKIASIFLPLAGGVVVGLIVALPFLFLYWERGLAPAFYEGISMLTTNGASAYAADEVPSYAVSLWRAMVSWGGGLVAVGLTLTILANLNSGGLQSYRSRLQLGDSGIGSARFRATVRALFPVYAIVTGGAFVLLLVSGAGFFNSLVLSFGTISTSGVTHSATGQVFGTGTQLVVLVFMLLSAMHWDIFYAKLKGVKNLRIIPSESRQMFAIIGAAAVLIYLLPTGNGAIGAWESLFITVSAITTTGYAPGTLTLPQLILPLSIVLLFLAAIGGTVGGTTGGIKQLRLRVLAMLARVELKRLAHPHGIFPLKISGVRLPKQDIEAVWLIFGSFAVAISVACLLLAILGIHFQDAVILSFTALTLSGPLAYLIDPTFPGFTGLNDPDYMVLSIVMLLGRVEMSVFMALLARTFWRR